MNRLTRVMVASMLAVVLAGGLSPKAFALGFRNPDQGARATGQGEAFAAQADDASAIYYNPAGLTQIDGTEVTSGGILTFRHIEFNGAAGSDLQNDPTFVPSLFIATDLGLDNSKWRFGLGVYVPFGNSSRWGNGPFQYILRQASLTIYDYAPTVAYQVNDHFSVGVGLNIYQGHTELRFDYSPLAPGARALFEGDNEAIGATVGLLWKINEQHAIGLVYRSPFSVDFHGKAAIPGITPSSSASAEITFPQSITAGYAFRPTAKLKLEVDVDWTNWETLNTVRLHSSDVTITSDPRTTIPFNWMDSFYYEFGAQYDLNENWVVRGGYIYSENTVPTSTFSPSLPDSNRHVFSVGLGYDSKKAVLFSKASLIVDIAYQYGLSEDRTIATGASAASPFVDGKWKSDAHSVMLTTTIKF